MIQNECAVCGIEHKVETQGGLGIEKELTQEDVDSADIATVPMAALKKCLHHPLTDQGLASFEADWKRSSLRPNEWVAPASRHLVPGLFSREEFV